MNITEFPTSHQKCWGRGCCTTGIVNTPDYL